MSTQTVAIKPAKCTYKTIGHDKLIIGLGEELQALYLEYNRLEDVAIASRGESLEEPARDAHDETYQKMLDICSALSRLKASTLEAAAIQMRVVSHYSSLDYDTVDKKLTSLIFSVVGVLESHGGFVRDQWAGNFYFGVHDPFERIEV